VKQSIVVVGAGIVGCAIARELASRGADCTIVEDRGVAGGATQASAGMLAPYVEAHERGPLLDLGIRSLQLYRDWIVAVRRESRLPVEFDAIGTLEVADSVERAAALKAASAEHGRFIDPGELQREYPQVRESFGGRLTSEHGYVNAGQLANALAQAADGYGAAFLSARVERITREGGALRIDTTSQTLRPDRVVLAAGAWANGIQGIHTPPIKPIRGQIVQLAWPGRTLRSIVWGPRCYVVPRLDRTVLVGATAEDAGFDERTTAAGIRDLLGAACDLLPEACQASFLDARAGLRPMSPDGLPVLGTDPREPAIIHAAGHYRNGVLLAPITAKLIGDLILDGRADALLEDFRADRFD